MLLQHFTNRFDLWRASPRLNPPTPSPVTHPLLIRSHISLVAPSALPRLQPPGTIRNLFFCAHNYLLKRTSQTADWARLFSHGMQNIRVHNGKSLSSFRSRLIFLKIFRRKQTHCAIVTNGTSPARATLAATTDKHFFFYLYLSASTGCSSKNEIWMIKTMLHTTIAHQFSLLFSFDLNISHFTFHPVC